MKLIAAGGNGGGNAEGGGGGGQQQILIRVPTSQHLGIPTLFYQYPCPILLAIWCFYHLQIQKNMHFSLSLYID